MLDCNRGTDGVVDSSMSHCKYCLLSFIESGQPIFPVCECNAPQTFVAHDSCLLRYLYRRKFIECIYCKSVIIMQPEAMKPTSAWVSPTGSKRMILWIVSIIVVICALVAYLVWMLVVKCWSILCIVSLILIFLLVVGILLWFCIASHSKSYWEDFFLENRNWRVERNAPTLTGLRNDSFVPDGQITETTRRLNDGHYMMQYPGAVVKSLPGTLDATQSGTVDRPRGRTAEKARTGVSYQTAPAFSLPLINEREENYREVDSKVHGRLSIIEHQINDSTLQTFQSSNRKSSMGQNKSSIKDVDEGLSSRDSKSRRNMVSQCQLNSPQTAQSPLGGKQKILKTVFVFGRFT